MKHLLSGLLLAVLVATTSSCDYIPFSGGKLAGQVATPTPGWPDVAAAQVIQIETNPTDPYSVKLWVAVVDNKPYIHAGKNRSTWVEHLEQNAELKLGLDQKLFELTATRVTSQEEFDAFAAVWEEKYGNPPRNLDVNEVYAYRLDPRP